MRAACLLGLLFLAFGPRLVWAEFPYDREPINYGQAPLNDPISQLQKKLSAGTARLEWNPKHGYLVALLRELGVSPASQTLVFSKTSFQRPRIDPHAPRALYYNDETYVGFVQQGEVLELATQDPRQGTIFYTLSQKQAEAPRFVRHIDDCISCHATSRTHEVPGVFVRSVFPDATGEPVYRAGTFDVTQATPLKQRWGGWYVTGKHGTQPHMGNTLLKDADAPEKFFESLRANVTDLATLMDTEPYLTAHSDIVALLVLEHQVRTHNLLTFANYDARAALWYNTELNKAFNQPAETRSESTARRLKLAAESLLGAMLFADETPLAGRIEGTSNFASEFAARGPRDHAGRSLREFNLETRIFKYPLSYLIYSAQFDGLPAEVRENFYHRLHEILAGRDTGPEAAHLSAASRQAILEILRETKPGLPDYFKAG